MSLDETVVEDYDALGFSLNAHPIGLIRAELDKIDLNKAHVAAGAPAGRGRREGSHSSDDSHSHEGTEARIHAGKGAGSRERGAEKDQGAEGPGHDGEAKIRARSASEGLALDVDETLTCASGSGAAPRSDRGPDRESLRVVPSEQLCRMRNGQRVAVAGLVTCRQRPGTAKGIVFMTIEDETGMANLVLRPEVYDREWRVARNRIALIAEGKVERQGDVIHVMVRRMYDLSQNLSDLSHRSRDFH
jgi:hypothetical protein